MRIFIAATLLASLFATNLLAAETTGASNAPLAPGKAAGVKKAQGEDNTIWWLAGGAAAIAIVAVAASGGSSTPAAAGGTTTTTTTST